MVDIFYLAEKILPILVMIGLGMLCRKTGIVKPEAIEGFSGLIFNVLMPVMLFRAFYRVSFDMDTAVILVVMFCCAGILLAAGLLLQKLCGFGPRMYPFLIATFEGGMIGYPLYILLAGEENLHWLATLDLGQTIFVFTVTLSVMFSRMGEKKSMQDTLKSMLSNKILIGMLLGCVFGILGLGNLIAESVVGPPIASILDFILAPMTGLILIVLGYEFAIAKGNVKMLVVTILSRLVIMALLLAGVSLVLFSLMPYDRNLMLALAILFSLPPGYAVPILAAPMKETEYGATVLSLYTLLTLVVFVGLVALFG